MRVKNSERERERKRESERGSEKRGARGKRARRPEEKTHWVARFPHGAPHKSPRERKESETSRAAAGGGRGKERERMAGERAPSRNNESRRPSAEGVAGARGEQPHSRVGGILECDPAGAPGNSKNSPSGEQQQPQPQQPVDGLCRYASGGMSFVEICQVRATPHPQGATLGGTRPYQAASSGVRFFSDCL